MAKRITVAGLNIDLKDCPDGVAVGIMLLTVEIAQALLSVNVGNRRCRNKHAGRLAAEITNDRWKLNFSAIIIDSIGHLLDGQHRCEAVIRTGIAVRTLVIIGVSPDVKETHGVICPRDGADTLTQAGEKQATALAAALGVVNRYLTSQMHLNFAPTGTELISLLKDHRGVAESLTWGGKTKIINPRLLVAFHYLFSQKDRAAADAYLEQLTSGASIGPTDPAYVVREFMLKNSLSVRKVKQQHMAAIMVKGWNALRKGVPMKIARWTPDESFPIVE